MRSFLLPFSNFSCFLKTQTHSHMCWLLTKVSLRQAPPPVPHHHGHCLYQGWRRQSLSTELLACASLNSWHLEGLSDTCYLHSTQHERRLAGNLAACIIFKISHTSPSPSLPSERGLSNTLSCSAAGACHLLPRHANAFKKRAQSFDLMPRWATQVKYK